VKDKYTLGHPDAFKYANEAFEWFKENYHHRYGTIREHDGLIEIHTGGWSDNETLVEQLKKTAWWLLHFKAIETGGHYYFATNNQLFSWTVVKTEKI